MEGRSRGALARPISGSSGKQVLRRQYLPTLKANLTHLSMKRGTGGKEPVEHCWILFAIIGNGLQLLGKRHMAAVLGAQTQGETHRQNDTSLAGRPKDTNPYPGRDPYRGIPKGGRPPKAAAPFCGGGAKRRLLCMGLPMGTGSCLWDARPEMCRFGCGFLHGSEHRALSHRSFLLWVSA